MGLTPQARKNRTAWEFLEQDFLTHGYHLRHKKIDELLVDNEDILTVDQDESEFGESAESLLLFMKNLKGTASPRYNYPPSHDRKGRAHIQLTRIGERLQHCLHALHLVRAHRPKYDFHPWVKAFLEVIESPSRVRSPDIALSQAERDALQFQSLLDDLHARANCKGVLDAVAAKERNKNAVFSRIRTLVDTHLQRTASILICRLDLHYPPRSAGDDFEKIHPPVQVAAEIQALLDYAKKTYRGYLAYIVRLEYGHSRGLHAHLAILLNGSVHQQDISISQDLGMFWKNEVTEGEGSFFNCNLSKPRYTHLGIGKIHYSDSSKEIGISKMLVYLCKPDLYFPSSPAWKNVRKIRKSKPPPALPTGQKAKGRPRRKPHGLVLNVPMPSSEVAPASYRTPRLSQDDC